MSALYASCLKRPIWRTVAGAPPPCNAHPVDLYAEPDESDAGALRRQLARELDIPESALAKTRIARPARLIITEVEEASEPLPPSNSQYLVGKYLEVVVTVEGRGFEIAEYQCSGGAPTAIWPARRLDGALTFEEGAGLLQVLSPENRAVVIDSFIRRLSDKRRRRYTTCKYCKKKTPPESLWGLNVCDGCASTELGILF